MDMLYNLE